MKEELKYSTMVNGVRCVMTDGVLLMPMWYADNWDLEQGVLMTELILVKDQDQYGLIMLYALAMSQH